MIIPNFSDSKMVSFVYNTLIHSSNQRTASENVLKSASSDKSVQIRDSDNTCQNIYTPFLTEYVKFLSLIILKINLTNQYIYVNIIIT